MKRVFCLPALLGIFVLGLTQAQAGPVFFRPIAENIDIRTNVIGNNNVVVNNITKTFAGNVFGIVGGGIDPPVPAFNPFNGFATPPGPANATYDSSRNLSTATFSGPGGTGQNILGLTLQNNEVTHIGLPFVGGGQAGPGGKVTDKLDARTITMNWDDNNGNHTGNFPVIGVGVTTDDGGPAATVGFSFDVTPASNIQTFQGFEFASTLPFNEHGYFQVDPNNPWTLIITNPNPFDITISGNIHIDHTGALQNIATLTEFPPQSASDEGKYLAMSGLNTVPDSFYNTPFFSTPQTIAAGETLVMAIPEPSIAILFAAGLIFVLGYTRKRQFVVVRTIG
jgi:hypothetical protein